MRMKQQTVSMAFHFQSLSACWPAQEVGTLNSRFGKLHPGMYPMNLPILIPLLWCVQSEG